MFTKLLANLENIFSLILPTPKLMTSKITPLRNTATLNLCHCIINPLTSVLFIEMFHFVIRSGANIPCLSGVTKREMTNVSTRSGRCCHETQMSQSSGPNIDA